VGSIVPYMYLIDNPDFNLMGSDDGRKNFSALSGCTKTALNLHGQLVMILPKGTALINKGVFSSKSDEGIINT